MLVEQYYTLLLLGVPFCFFLNLIFYVVDDTKTCFEPKDILTLVSVTALTLFILSPWSWGGTDLIWSKIEWFLATTILLCSGFLGHCIGIRKNK